MTSHLLRAVNPVLWECVYQPGITLSSLSNKLIGFKRRGRRVECLSALNWESITPVLPKLECQTWMRCVATTITRTTIAGGHRMGVVFSPDERSLLHRRSYEARL